MNDNNGLRLVEPGIKPVLEPAHRPAALTNRAFRDGLRQHGGGVPVTLVLEQSDGTACHFPLAVYPAGAPEAAGNFTYIERFVKFILWSRGGCTVYFDGPADIGTALQRHFRETATGKFDAEIMGDRIYEKPFSVVLGKATEFPKERQVTAALGRHLQGYRIGFDLGASDRKVAAIVNGECVFSEEIVWNPVVEKDPQYHYDQIMDSLKRAAGHMPRVDAIGGSSAGVYVNNRVKVASLFRGVPRELFNSRVKDLFLEMRRAWNNIPFEVVNDGEVTALAGSMSIHDNAVLGIALGSSQAGGYVTEEGNITPWLNELAFVPVDYNPQAAVDEWSGDYGCGAQYFSQQCVGRLLKPAGIDLPKEMSLPDKLKDVQKLMDKGDDRALRIYQTIGTYLGYAIAHYADFYRIRNVLILGRVTSGPGGTVIIEGAKAVLQQEFPEHAKAIAFNVPDERDKRHGQAIAAASLPQA